jgi:hypothetical protein
MLNIFLDNLTFIIIGFSVILMIILGYFLVIKPNSYVSEENHEENKPEPIHHQEHKNRKRDEKSFENYILDNDMVSNEEEPVDDEPIIHSETEVQSDENILTADALLSNLDQAGRQSNHSMDQPPETDQVKEDEQKEKTSNDDDLGKYHVLYRDKDNMWYVKRENSKRTIRVLHTKREAIAYATIKAINQDTNIVIHGKDGKIEKHGY